MKTEYSNKLIKSVENAKARYNRCGNNRENVFICLNNISFDKKNNCDIISQYTRAVITPLNHGNINPIHLNL